jgi:hypothetical protein
MTGRTTRIAATGAGALLAVGIFTAAPADASDAVQTDANVQARTDLVNQTVDVLNRACIDATRAADGAAASTLASDHGVTVAAGQAGTGLNLAVSLPALTESLPALADSVPLLGSLPLLGSVGGQVDADPVTISCATSADGAGIGLSAAGVDALVEAVAPGVDLSDVDLSGLPADVAASAGASTGSAALSAGTTGATGATGATGRAGTAGSASASTRATLRPSSRIGAAASPAPAAVDANLAASSAGGIVDQTLGNPAGLARTGAGVGTLGLLGTALIGSGRLMAFGRKLLRAF